MSDIVLLTTYCPVCKQPFNFYDQGKLTKQFHKDRYGNIEKIRELFVSYKFGDLGESRVIRHYIHPDHQCPYKGQTLEDFA